MRVMEAADQDAVFVCDVGNHSFLATNAYAYSGASNRILYSGSFGTLGSALPKAVGAYYSTKRPVVCFTGDQGFQMNIQELQAVGQNHLPVTVVVINNFSSGMIKEREEKKYGSHFVHTTLDSGYGIPDLRGIAEAYQMEYRKISTLEGLPEADDTPSTAPCLIDLWVDGEQPLRPNLPVGNSCQDLEPEIPRELYRYLEELE